VREFNITRHQLDWVLFGLRQLFELAPLTRVPVRRELRAVFQQLDDLLMFAHEPESATDTPQLNLIGVKAVAIELGCTPQHVRRIAKDIGGHLVEGRFVFRREDVIDYAEGRK
jgi:hypothetical protein